MLKKKKELWISGILFLLIGIVFFYLKINFHELWKDEWQSWTLVRDKNIIQIFQFLHFEGHPSLWFFYLKPWAICSNMLDLEPNGQALLFKMAHGTLFLFALFLLLFRFKMPLLLRAAFAGSFFFFYQYGVVLRGYMLLIALLFLLVTLLQKNEKPNLKIAILLVLLCQTEIYGVFMAAALFLVMGYDFYKEKKTIRFWESTPLKQQAIAIGLGLFFFLLTVYPRERPKVIGANTDPQLVDNIAHAVQGNLTNTFLIGVIPDTNVFGYSVFGLLGAGVLLLLFVWLFYKDKGVLLAFLFYLLAVISFGTLVYQGGVRHWGVNFIFFIALLELYYRRNDKMVIGQQLLIGVFLLCQFYYNFLAINKEVRHPFSCAKMAGEFIKNKVPENVPIVAINKFEAVPVGAYSGRPLYLLPEGKTVSNFRWLDKVYLPTEQELKMFAKFKKKGGLIVLSPKPLGKDRYPNAELWKAFDQFNMKNENYYLYQLKAD